MGTSSKATRGGALLDDSEYTQIITKINVLRIFQADASDVPSVGLGQDDRVPAQMRFVALSQLRQEYAARRFAV